MYIDVAHVENVSTRLNTNSVSSLPTSDNSKERQN